ncbi:MAG TPA: DUF3014 domain-containing protein [Burkholderiales bacterium]|nr:DUF3014 domain-containing protein [Burkholderiales bacterium]
MKNTGVWLIVIVLAVAAGGYYYWRQSAQPEPAPAPPPPVAEPAPAEPKAGPEHPLAEAEPVKLPALDQSDATLVVALSGVLGQKQVAEFFHLNGMVRRFVACIDNLPREKVAQKLMPVKPTAGSFATAGEEGSAVISPDNARRYSPALKLAETADPKKLVAVYVHFYPLFQQAYAELGYPNAYFNDRLVQVIDHLLAAPEVRAPVRVVRPKVMYQFADPELEALSAGHKIMVRIGSENAARLKARLREIRSELVARSPKSPERPG